MLPTQGLELQTRKEGQKILDDSPHTSHISHSGGFFASTSRSHGTNSESEGGGGSIQNWPEHTAAAHTAWGWSIHLIPFPLLLFFVSNFSKVTSSSAQTDTCTERPEITQMMSRRWRERISNRHRAYFPDKKITKIHIAISHSAICRDNSIHFCIKPLVFRFSLCLVLCQKIECI